MDLSIPAIPKGIRCAAVVAAAGVAFASVGLPQPARAQATDAATIIELRDDVETEVNGVEMACTGIGQTRLDPRWGEYPVRVEFSNALNEYLPGGAIRVRGRAGRELFAVSCKSPWILLRLPAGSYRIQGWLPGSQAKPRSASFRPPAKGQMRLVLQFPDG